MKRNVELILKDVGSIDISSKDLNKFGLELTYYINDLTDVGSRKSSYSKSFKIYGTPNNNQIFKHVYDVNFESTTYDINKKQACFLTIDKNIVIDGYLKIRNIEKTYNAGKYEIIYTVNVYDEVKSIFSEIGDDKLQDLDFSEPFIYNDTLYNSGNHIFNENSILASQQRDKIPTNVYDYCVVNYNYNGSDAGINWPSDNAFNLSQFYPSIYVKAIVDKILSGSGYSYDSDFFNGDTYDGMYTSLGTIYNGSTMLVQSATYHGITADADQSMQNTWDSTITEEPSDEDYTDIVITSNKDYTIDDDILSGDNSIKILGAGTYKFSGYYTCSGTTSPYATVTLASYINFWDGEDFLLDEDPESDSPAIYIQEYVHDGLSHYFEIVLDLPSDAVITPKVRVGIDQYFVTGWIGQNYTLDSFNMDVEILYSNVETDYTDKTISISQFLPDVTQAEFLKSVIKQFNLYIYPIKYETKKLTIEPKKDFYQKGEILEWTDKVNEDTYSFTPTSKSINRYYSFTMDSFDTLDTNSYEEKYELNYGDKYIDTGNDDITGTNTINSIFGGYSYTQKSTTVSIPNLVKEITDSYSTCKNATPPAIGFIANHDTTTSTWGFANSDRATNTDWNTINHYEYFTDRTVEYDVNFTTLTSFDQYNNSYINFWSKDINNILNINNRIVTYYVNLTVEDIVNIDMKNVVTIKGELYYFQKIVTDILSGKPSKIELIKAYDYIRQQSFLIWGVTDLGASYEAGTIRPTANRALLAGGNRIETDTSLDITIEANATVNGYFWFATPVATAHSVKNKWFIDTYNNGEIGGDENLGGNLLPEPTLVEIYDVVYNVWVSNYQTAFDTIVLCNVEI